LERKAVSGIMLTLLLTSMLTLAFSIRLVKAQGVIYIRPDGSVEGTDKIQRDGNTYTFTDNIYDEICVERSNVIIDGKGYTVQGTGVSGTNGISLSNGNNVTIKDTHIKGFDFGIYLYNSSRNCISGNVITANNYSGISLTHSSGNCISGNNISNNGYGIGLGWGSLGNSISGNTITANNGDGIYFQHGDCNNITANTIENNICGIGLYWGRYSPSLNNTFYHNNFIANTQQVNINLGSMRLWVNLWDDGYPSGGNFWSDYTDADFFNGPYQNITGCDGIGDTPYVIDENNRDNYPLMNPWTPTPRVVTAAVYVDPNTLNLRSEGKWITAYVQLPQGYGAADIHSSSIRLNGTISPVLDAKYDFVTNSSEYLVDHNNDGILERMVKFNRTEVSESIFSKGIRYGNVALTLTGQFYDNTPFEGSDTIMVRMPGDVNGDGFINTQDLAWIGKTFGAKVGEPLYNIQADFNSDGIIDTFELATVGKNFGKTYQ
jgi:parallel beta-helix repeat protein